MYVLATRASKRLVYLSIVSISFRLHPCRSDNIFTSLWMRSVALSLAISSIIFSVSSDLSWSLFLPLRARFPSVSAALSWALASSTHARLTTSPMICKFSLVLESALTKLRIMSALARSDSLYCTLLVTFVANSGALILMLAISYYEGAGPITNFSTDPPIGPTYLAVLVDITLRY